LSMRVRERRTTAEAHSSPDVIAGRWQEMFTEEPDSFAASPRDVLKARKSPLVRMLVAGCRPQPGAWILEAGCGGGQFGLALATKGLRAFELDFSRQMLRNVHAAAQRLGQRNGHMLFDTVQGDITALPASDARFDVTFNEGVIEHWTAPEDRIRILSELARVTKPGGQVVVCIPHNCHPLYSWWYFLQRLFRSGWLVYRPGGSLEEARIGADQLRRELEAAGLSDVCVDGFAVTRTIAHYPRWVPLRALAKLAELLLPEFPPSIRRRWGVYLVGMGRKPSPEAAEGKRWGT
jgi:ubiquinone/menaquinone biosynthesis C-methylase UbiE